MELRRTLSLGMEGDDVAQLHDSLAAIGIEVADDERSEQRFGPSTRDAVARLQAVLGVPPSGEVDESTFELARTARERVGEQLLHGLGPVAHGDGGNAGPPSGEWSVFGTVSDANGEPLAGASVTALQRSLRDARPVGRDRTDDEGRYSIAYTPQAPPSRNGAAADPGGPDLQLQIAGDEGKVLLTSRLYCHVPRRLEVSLALGGTDGEPELTRVRRAVAKRLDGLSPEQLLENDDHQDLTFLSCDTGIPKSQIALYSAAARLSHSTELPVDAFYGLFRQGVPADADVRVLAEGEHGMDLDANAQRLLQGALSASGAVREKAIEAAIAAGTVAPGYRERAPEDLKRLAQLDVEATLAATNGMGKTPIGDVLDTVKIAPDKQQEFVNLYTATPGATRQVWRNLKKHPSFTEQEVTDLRFAVDLGRFTRGHVPLMEAIVEMRGRNAVSGAADLARMTAGDWTKLISQERGGRQIGVPQNFTAGEPRTTVDAYAHMLERNFERAYPTTAFSARLAADAETPFQDRDEVVRFLDANPDFNLLRTNVDRFLKDKPQAVNGSKDGVREALLTGQRLLKVAPRYETAKPLLRDGIASAQQIYSMGRSRFVDAYKQEPSIGEAEARRIYNAAEQTYSLALVLATNLNPSIAGIDPVAIVPTATPVTSDPAAAPAPQPAPDLAGFPNLQTLFGSLDMCACRSCRSVLSPAAYMADLLRFLSHRHTNGKTAKDVLLERRPDLVQIELSCPNTNTVLPYIDLVNELLEDAVAPPADAVAAARARQTTLTTDELNGNPQYVNHDAYAKLATAVHPWTLPFDLPLAEARTYLGQLGTNRVALMRAFRQPAPLPSADAIAIAIEGLGLSPVEADIITGGPLAAGHQPWDFWGLAVTGNTVRDPVDLATILSGSWIDVLGHVRVLNDRAGIDHATLTQLLNTRFVNGDGAVTVVCDPPDSCDLATMTVSGLTPEVLTRLHRFTRLMRRLGWSPYELDAAIAQLQSREPNVLGRLNTTLLRQLHAVKSAMARFGLPAMQALALFTPIDTHDVPPVPGEESPQPSLYRQLFQDLAVLNPVDPAFALNAAGSEIAATATNPKLADHRATLVAAFELPDADLSLAIDALTDGALTLGNLSTLYRNVLLARGLNATLRELISLESLVERETDVAPFHELVNPFDSTSPELLAAFCEAVDGIRATRFSIPQLDYLLRHSVDPTAGVAPDDVIVGTLLKAIRDGLAKIAAENAFAPDPTGATVRRRLATVLAKPDAEAVMAILGGTTALAPADQSALVAATLGGLIDAAGAQANLVGGAALAPGAARYEYVLAQLLAHFRATLGTSLVVHSLAEALGLPTATAAMLAGSWLHSRVDPARPLVDDLLALADVPRDPDRDAQPIARDELGFGVYFDEYTALDKAAQTLAGFNLTSDEIDWLRSFGIGTGWLDPTALPLAPVATPEGRFRSWARLAQAVEVKAKLPSDGTPFTALMDLARTAAKPAWFAALAARTKWTPAGIAALAGDPANAADGGLLSLKYPDDFRSERALARLVQAFGLLRRLGLPADGVGAWIAAAVTAAQADAIKQSVKAKYSTSEWPEIAKPLRDVLREQQRDALVSWLLAHPPADAKRWHEANDIYARYLIDVEMAACGATSRIVQANATIQLFVQRCILNLEDQVTVDAEADADWLQWKWMSRYRVWEANRKVFLYPENWIEPGLRTDKSPFFQEMENELLQAPVTKDTAEDAFATYLDKLDGVARLEVVGTFFEAGSPTVLHVIGRKQGDPPEHYYRQWIDSSRWTAWTKIDLDITGPHVMPVVWNRRLYVFWGIVQRKPNRSQTNPNMTMANSPPPPTGMHLEVQLAWSELKGRKWLPKQVSPQTLVIPRDSEPHFVTFKSSIADPLLRIDVFVDVDWDRKHFAEFVLGGVGNSVEAFAVSQDGLGAIGPQTRNIGTLAPALVKGTLELPTDSDFEANTIVPASFGTVLSPQRQRVSACYTTYDVYGSLSSEVVLDQADRYRLVVPHQTLRFDSALPFFFADGMRSYFVIPTVYYQNGNYFQTTAPASVYRPVYRSEYKFAPFYHAFVPLFARQLKAGGVDRLYERRLQLDPAGVQGIAPFDFRTYYHPTSTVNEPFPIEGVDFDYDAGYSIYNWELFFHAPFQIAESLSANQRFEEAKHWYEYVFDPTSKTKESLPQRYWITKPFFQMTRAGYQAQQIQRLMKLINQHDAATEHQVAEWRANPFEPHIVAGMRPVAYQRAIVMKYIDNLIAWGDQLFRQDTLESINEATQLYVLAAELLGPKPEIVQAKADPPAKTFADIDPLDEFANASVTAAENALQPVKINVPADPSAPALPLFPTLYFCVPPNQNLLAYWDVVADRLFKIRHCMNIEGVVRQLALFAPPIDPALLVKAAAAGLDLGSVLSDMGAASPPYRFQVMLREAVDLAQGVRALGNDLLVCLEKRDAERLQLLRSAAERKLQDKVRAVQQRSIDEADKQIEVIDRNQAVMKTREDWLSERKDDLTNTWEAAALVASAGSIVAEAIAMGLHTGSGAAHAFPEAQFGGSGAGGTPHVTAKLGGPNAGRAADGWGKAARIVAAVLQTGSQMSSVLGQYQRRKDEWGFQLDLATRELDQIASQRLGAQIRKDIAQKQRDNHEIVANSASDVDDFLHDKFTNQDLYDWMVGQTSAVYFQAYQLAYTVAKRAEECYRRELGLSDSSFIQFGYWDSLKKGLLTGDRLLHDLQRMEAAYLADNERELELTRHASLLSLDPYALVELRTKGECTVRIPELWFDLDTPGHYMRRLKSVGVTVPCVVGPYTGVSLTLTLLDNHVRTRPEAGPAYARQPGDDPRFVDDQGGASAVVTSSAQDDSGMFELRLDDQRYLPFEGAGAVSTWKLRLNSVYPQFDYDTISDVVLHLRYTARDAGGVLGAAATAAVKTQVNAMALAGSRQGLYTLISARQEHGTAWNAFLHPAPGQEQVLTFDTDPGRFPFFTNGLSIKVTGIDVLARLSDPGDHALVVTRPGVPAQPVTMTADPTLAGLHRFSAHPLTPKSDLGRSPANPPYPSWSFKLQKAGAADFRSLAPEAIDDLVVILQYEVAP